MTENKGLKQLQAVADRVVTDHPHLFDQYPYDKFAKQSVLSEDALVRRQIYEVLKRQKASEVLDNEEVNFFLNEMRKWDRALRLDFWLNIWKRKCTFCLTKER